MSTARVLIILMEDSTAEIMLSFLETLGYTLGGIQVILPSKHISATDLLEYAFAIEEDYTPYVPLEEIVMKRTLSTTDVSSFLN